MTVLTEYYATGQYPQIPLPAYPSATSLPEFDAISIKPLEKPPGSWFPSPKINPQRLTFAGQPLRDIIKSAFGLDDYQLLGAPAWTSHEFYSISATTAEKALPPGRELVMACEAKVMLTNGPSGAMRPPLRRSSYCKVGVISPRRCSRLASLSDLLRNAP